MRGDEIHGKSKNVIGKNDPRMLVKQAIRFTPNPQCVREDEIHSKSKSIKGKNDPRRLAKQAIRYNFSFEYTDYPVLSFHRPITPTLTNYLKIQKIQNLNKFEI